jgi:signal transduction histidine kinase
MHYTGPMLAPLLLGALVYYFMREPLNFWRNGEAIYDEYAIKEWVREARVGSNNVPEMLKDFLQTSRDSTDALQNKAAPDPIRFAHEQKRAEIKELLQALCLPPTKIYAGQLPLFPVIYRLEIRFDDELTKTYDSRLNFAPIVWDSENPRHPNQYRALDGYQLFRDEGVRVHVQYQLHAYMQKQFKERRDEARSRLINIWVLVFAFLALLWMLFIQRRESQRERQRLATEQQIHESRQKHLEEELRRQEAERKQEEAERRQLEEELRRQEAEREKQAAESKALELKSQIFHSIGIMAKSYAHNIKNLLVRPNDLLRRCLEEHPAGAEQSRMLVEVKQTLGTVTERLQEILQTVQRDPDKFETVRIDLNSLATALQRTWADQAEAKWKMVIDLDLTGEPAQCTHLAPRDEKHLADRDEYTSSPLYVIGDRSHLQQTLENFLFNARDAIAEMRNHLRQRARLEGATAPLDDSRRQALITAAGWKGRVVFRTYLSADHPVLEVEDNGIGMTPETRQHCTEPNYSTKRNNALYAGMSAGMGLGLSFVQMILEHHGATLEIVSKPLKGALFRVRFPAMKTKGEVE